MEKKGYGILIFLVVFAVGAVVGWPHIQWFRFTLEVRDVLREDIGRYPGADEVVGLPALLSERAKKYGCEALKVEQTLVARQQGPVVFWFLLLHLRSGSHEFEAEHRVESSVDHGYIDPLEEAGIKVVPVGG